MGGEELFHLIAHRGGTEPAQRGNSTAASESGDLFGQRVPVGFQVVPCDRTRGGLGEQRGKEADVILLPQLALVDQGQRAPRQFRLGKRGQREEVAVVL